MQLQAIHGEVVPFVLLDCPVVIDECSVDDRDQRIVAQALLNYTLTHGDATDVPCLPALVEVELVKAGRSERTVLQLMKRPVHHDRRLQDVLLNRCFPGDVLLAFAYNLCIS